MAQRAIGATPNITGKVLFERDGADLHGADLHGAQGVVCCGYDTRGYRFVGVRHNDGWRVLAGCRWFTISEAIAHWTAKGNKDALARIRILGAHE